MTAQSTGAYPVVVQGELDSSLSRWLWLVKWVLIVPHIIVLFFLWIAFVIVTVIAFFAILFTGRYPRGMFDFNVGVLRWTWRVGFYSYSALGTDRYPPFSLKTEDYPANLEVEYPSQLSRGRVLIKSWLLAFPQLLIVTVLGDLLDLLVFFAAIVLLFRGRYPGDLFELSMGINRWTLRVIAYIALMRDEYPPFRLDP